jgi:hypothetical protein
VGLGHRQQLGHVHAVGGGLANQGGSGLLIAIAGGRSHGQPQPMPGRRRPSRRRERPGAVAVGVGGGSIASCPWRPRRASGPAWDASAQVRAPGKTSVGRQDRARATIACALAQ